MPTHDFNATRLFLRTGIAGGTTTSLDRNQANYLVNVLRLSDGDDDSGLQRTRWRMAGDARAAAGARPGASKSASRCAPQPADPDLHYLFAPLKQARLDYMVQKAVEMGVGRLRPVLTQHGQVSRVNLERMEANAIEAAEQCGILTVPAVDEPVALNASARCLAGARGRAGGSFSATKARRAPTPCRSCRRWRHRRSPC